MGLDPLLFHKPTNHLGSAISAVAGKTFWIGTEPIHAPPDHRLGCANLGLANGARRFDVDDHSVISVDQIVGGISEESWTTQRAGPLGCRI